MADKGAPHSTWQSVSHQTGGPAPSQGAWAHGWSGGGGVNLAYRLASVIILVDCFNEGPSGWQQGWQRLGDFCVKLLQSDVVHEHAACLLGAHSQGMEGGREALDWCILDKSFTRPLWP